MLPVFAELITPEVNSEPLKFNVALLLIAFVTKRFSVLIFNEPDAIVKSFCSIVPIVTEPVVVPSPIVVAPLLPVTELTVNVLPLTAVRFNVALLVTPLV